MLENVPYNNKTTTHIRDIRYYIVNFYDPDMAANTGFPVMEWWA